MATKEDLAKYGVKIYQSGDRYYYGSQDTLNSAGKVVARGKTGRITGTFDPTQYDVQVLDKKTAGQTLNRMIGTNQGAGYLDKLVSYGAAHEKNLAAEIEGNKLAEQNRLEELKNPAPVWDAAAQEAADARRNALLPAGVKPGEAYGSALTNQAKVGDAYSKDAIYDPDKIQNVNGTFQATPQQPTAGANGVSVGADGQPVEGGASEGVTLDEIQASPIPEFPAEFGQGSGMDRVNWALQHRANIYQAYQKYGITPSADEVNFQLQNNPDINSIEASIKQAVESGQDTRGTMPQSNVTAVAETKAQNVVDSIGTAQSLSDVAKQVSEALGLPELTKELDDLDIKMGEEIMAINDNPWLSEAERSKRTQLIQSKYESRKEGVVERLRLQNDVLGQAMDYYEKDRQYQQDMLFKQIDQQNKEVDQQMKMMQMEQDAMKMDTQVSTKDGRSVLMNMQTGEVIADLGAVKVSGGGGGGGGTSTETKARTTASKLIQQIGSGDMDWGTAWDSFSTEFPQYSNIQIDALLGGGYIDSEATLQALKSAGANVGNAKVGDWWGRAK